MSESIKKAGAYSGRSALLSANALKIMAMLIMTIDHIGYVFSSGMPEWLYYVCRGIGRLAFPLFCFFISEGLVYTKSRFRYCVRLFVFAVISEIPFDLMNYANITFRGQNVMWGLLFGAVAVTIIERLDTAITDGSLRVAAQLGTGAAFCIAGWLLRLDYKCMAVIYIMIFYFLKSNKGMAMLSFGAAVTAFTAVRLLDSVSVFNILIPLELLSLGLIALYNGKKGIGRKVFRYAFYLYYPLHQLLLYLLFLLWQRH